MCWGGPPTDWGEFVQADDDRAIFQALPTTCSALRRFFIRETFQAPQGARGFSRKNWIRIWGGVHLGGRPYPARPIALVLALSTLPKPVRPSTLSCHGNPRRALKGDKMRIQKKPPIRCWTAWMSGPLGCSPPVSRP